MNQGKYVFAQLIEFLSREDTGQEGGYSNQNTNTCNDLRNKHTHYVNMQYA